VLITADMSRLATPETVWLVNAVTGGITFKLFCSIPMCIAVLVDIADNLYVERNRSGLTEHALMRIRLGFWLILNVGAAAFFSSLQYLTAFIGINSMLISILLPLLFYYRLRHDELLPLQRVLMRALIVAAVAFTLLISYVDVAEFIKSLSE